MNRLQKSAPKIGILIPTWNNLEMLQLCLRSIESHSDLDHRIVLHVNEGNDGTLDWVRSNGIEHTYSAENVGICKALNLAAAKCDSEYLIYLNDDMYAMPGWDSALLNSIEHLGADQPVYVSGTLVQPTRFSPSNVIADFGNCPRNFDESGLLRAFHSNKLRRDDWNGATWPPCCIHRKWWDAIGGYSEEFTPGFYSDIEFSMKLWQIGCRHFRGVGSSLVYHFGEKTTSRVRGPNHGMVKRARIEFLKKWGILPSTFSRYYVLAGKHYREPTPEPASMYLRFERLRVSLLSAVYGLPFSQSDARQIRG